MEVFIVYKVDCTNDLWSHNPQGYSTKIIKEIVSVRSSEELAKEEVSNSLENLDYIRKIVR